MQFVNKVLSAKAAIKLLKVLQSNRKLRQRIIQTLIRLKLIEPAIRLRIKYRRQLTQTSLSSSTSETPTYILGNVLMSKDEWYRRFSQAKKDNDFYSRNNWQDHITPTSTSAELPLISVIISLYQADAYLNALENSILTQTLRSRAEFIFIVVAPSVQTLEAVARIVSKLEYSKVEIIPERIGIYEAWNIAIRISTTKYLTNWNADDTRAPMSLQIQIESLEKNEWAHVVYQDVYYSFEPNVSWKTLTEIGMQSDLRNVTARYLLDTGMNPPHNAPAWRKSLHDECGYFDESYKSAGDYEFWVRISLKNKNFYKTPSTHVGYFINPKGLSTSPGGPGLQETHRIRTKYLDELNSETLSAKRLLESILGLKVGNNADDVTRIVLERLRSTGGK